jgi:hypothetical protein
MAGTQDRYAPLLAALAAVPAEQDAVQFSLAALAGLFGRRLARRAHTAAYWVSSDVARQHWLRAGWVAGLDAATQTVTFTRWPGRRARAGPPVAWFRQLAALLAALPATQQTVQWTVPELAQQLGRLPPSVYTPNYWQTPAIRACWVAAGFTARYDRHTQRVTFTRQPPPGVSA